MRITNETLAVLSRCTTDGHRLKLPEQLDRPDYLAVNKVIEAMGGRWTRNVQAHVFTDDPSMQLESVLATGQITTAKDLGFFRTQGEALDRLMTEANIQPMDRVLEPSAGEGDIVRRIVESQAAHCTAIEIDPMRGAKVMALRDPGGTELITLVCDFLEVAPPATPDRLFDRVIMNPPFAVPGRPRADLDHVERALRWLAPGGRLVAIMASGVMFREDSRTKRFHEAMREHDHWFVELPADAFKASGTGVRTVILHLRKAD